MKFRMSFGIVKTVLIAVVIAACAAVLVLDIVLLIGTETLKTSSPIAAGVSMGAAALILIAAALLLFNSYYKICDDEMKLVLCVFHDVVKYPAISSVKQNTVTKEVYLCFEENGIHEDIRLNLSSARSDSFLSALREKCPDILIELITPPANEEKK